MNTRPLSLPPHPAWLRHSLAVLCCAATTLLATPLLGWLDPVNIAMLFLLTVLLVAVYLGLRPALLAAFLSVALFDFFFVPPRFSFAVHNAQYLVTFSVMLAVALTTGRLAAGLRHRVDAAAAEEARARALAEMARDLSGALTPPQAVDIADRFLAETFDARVDLLLPDAEGKLQALVPSGATGLSVEPRLTSIAFDQGRTVECSQLLSGGYAALYLPLKAPMRVRGVAAVAPRGDDASTLFAQRRSLEMMALLLAIAIERMHYVEVAQRTQVQVVSERLRSSILSAISHDLRTPLAALVGLADSLAVGKVALPTAARETAEAIREQAERLSGLVSNLLDMARLHAGEVTLNKEWQPIEEIIGASIALLGRALAAHPVRVSLPPDLPLVAFDAVLIERVFCNLLENAAKYAPPETPVEIVAHVADGMLSVSVCDSGPGFRAPLTPEIFGMFVRGAAETATPGVGLGLAICRAIVEAHGGRIAASNGTHGGACVSFSLPLGEPPLIEAEALTADGPR